jgi:hypothetical protein
VLKENAKKEFEQNKGLKDPLLIARKLVIGWEAVEETKRRFHEVEQVTKKHIESTRNRK